VDEKKRGGRRSATRVRFGEKVARVEKAVRGGGGSGVAVGQGSRKGGWGSRLSDDRRKEGRGCGSDRRAAAADNTPAAVHAGGRCSDRGCGRLAGGALAPSPPVDSIRF
jgi:hypothetical protein